MGKKILNEFNFLYKPSWFISTKNYSLGLIDERNKSSAYDVGRLTL